MAGGHAASRESRLKQKAQSSGFQGHGCWVTCQSPRPSEVTGDAALSGRDHLGRRGTDDREIQVCWRRTREENSVWGRRWRENQEKEAKESQSEYRTTGKGRERRAGRPQPCKQGGQTFPGAGDSDSPRAGPLFLPLQKELRPGRGPGASSRMWVWSGDLIKLLPAGAWSPARGIFQPLPWCRHF